MPRNFFRRIETAFPIEDGNLRERVINELLAISLRDNLKARFLQADGSYRCAAPVKGSQSRRSQWEFVARAVGEEDTPSRRAASKPRHPQVKLAPRPAALGRKRR